MAFATQTQRLTDNSGQMDAEPSNSIQLPTQEKAQSFFELGVSLSLCLWPALTLAVQNNWGGPSSADKRDWFAGAVVELFEDRPDTDQEDVETVLLQVMQDEFEVAVDDDSAFEVAEQVMRLRKDCGRGNFDEVEGLKERWDRRGGGSGATFKQVDRGDDEDDTEYDSDDLDITDDEDVMMGDTPAPREKPEPDIDEDGFTKVIGKKKR